MEKNSKSAGLDKCKTPREYLPYGLNKDKRSQAFVKTKAGTSSGPFRRRIKRILLVLALLSAGLASAQTLEMWTLALSPTFDDYINGVIADFEAEHDGVTVNWIDLPDGGFPDRFFPRLPLAPRPTW